MPQPDKASRFILPAPAALADFQRDWDGLTPYAIATLVRTVGSTAAKAGARAIVTHTGSLIGFEGGACARKALISAGEEVMKLGSPQSIRILPKDLVDPGAEQQGFWIYPSSCPSRGQFDFFVEPVLPSPPLVVFGASEIARQVLLLSDMAGLRPVAGLLGDARHGLDVLEVAAPEVAGLDGISDGFIVVATQGLNDRAALQAALATRSQHILFVSSRLKAERIFDALIQSGIDRIECNRISAPAGLDIGAATPSEIAISIVAEIIRRRRRPTASKGGAS